MSKIQKVIVVAVLLLLAGGVLLCRGKLKDCVGAFDDIVREQQALNFERAFGIPFPTNSVEIARARPVVHFALRLNKSSIRLAEIELAEVQSDFTNITKRCTPEGEYQRSKASEDLASREESLYWMKKGMENSIALVKTIPGLEE